MMPTNSFTEHDDVATQVKDKVANVGRAAAEKIDANLQSAASGLGNAASSLHENADSLPGGEKVSEMAHAAADKLGATADYVREHDVSGMAADLERLVRNNPAPALLSAAVIGFLVGRAMSND
ncbi:MAG: hypothetical protein ABI806_07755 [Candidatus Solibacter sp.]